MFIRIFLLILLFTTLIPTQSFAESNPRKDFFYDLKVNKFDDFTKADVSFFFRKNGGLITNSLLYDGPDYFSRSEQLNGINKNGVKMFTKNLSKGSFNPIYDQASDSMIITTDDGKFQSYDMNGRLQWTFSPDDLLFVDFFNLHVHNGHIYFSSR